MKLMRHALVAMTSCTLALLVTACKNEPKATATQDTQTSDSSAETGKVQYSLKADSRKWKVVSEDTVSAPKVTQFILAEESPEQASELFTVVEMSDVNLTPAEYFSQFITELQKRYENARVESKVINQQTNSVMGEWWIDGLSPDNTQHEWIRILKKGNDIAVLRYSTKHTDQLEQNRKTWESILNDASF